jgi:two-component system CheB/CheR fusion protein
MSVLSESRLRALAEERRHRETLEAEQQRRASADARLTAERERLTTITDNVPVLLANVDRERRFKFVNRPYAARLGLEPTDMIGRSIIDVLGADAAKAIDPYIDRTLAGETLQYEIALPYPRIGTRLMRVSYVPERDAAGSVNGYFAALEDITQVRTAESELKKFAFLVDNATDFIGICDLELRPFYVNAAGCRLVGLDGIDDLRNRSVLDFFYPEDLPFLTTEFFQRIQHDGHGEVEIRFRHFRTAEPLWMLYGVVLMRDVSGNPSGYATISTDLTRRKRDEEAMRVANERLRAALDASETGTFRWDTQTDRFEWDENLDRLFGLKPGVTVQSLAGFIELVHPDDRDRVIEACRRCAAEGSDFEEEFRVVRPDGTERWLYDKGRSYPGRDGRPAYVSGACVDITERRQKEDALREADRQKDEFLGMLAHELRNPLAPITYSLALLERHVDSEQAARPIQIISRQVQRMTRLVDDLLDVSRVTQGKISLQKERVDLSLIVRHAAEATRAVMDARQHRLEISVPDHPTFVRGDTARLGQIYENLLRNAAKYTPEGGRVRIELRQEDGQALVSVRDNGIGISATALPRVFDLFMQVDTSLDRSEGGLGIGLTLVDRLVRMHGGSVEAHSAGAGQGSEFVVRIPLETAAATASADGGAASRPKSRSRRYLIVDDNVDSSEALKLLLEFRGHTVQVVHDGREALAAARFFAPEVVLLDVGLPGLDGFEVVKQLRTSPETANLLVIATTGYGREEDRARCLAAGFNHHFAKPLDVDSIQALVEQLG